jgi:hypothetical protein
MRVGVSSTSPSVADVRCVERLVQVGLGDVDDPANQREAVRVRAARRDADEAVAGRNVASVDDRILLDDTDGKPGEIVAARRERSGMLGGLAADQRAAGEFAAVRDAFDDLGRHVDVELLADEIIEEEQRLGALHEHVVDTHRDEVDADRVVASKAQRQVQLRADPVGAGDEHRLAEALADLDQCAEAADAGQHLRAQRPLRERLDPFDERIAGVDVDAGLAIGKGRRRRTEGHDEVKCSVF